MENGPEDQASPPTDTTEGNTPPTSGGMRSCATLVSIILAVPLYLLSLPLIFSIGTGDAHSRALTPAFAMLLQVLMWALLSLFVLMRILGVRLPGHVLALGALLVLGGVAGSTVGIGMMSDPDLLVLPPVLLPVLALFFAAWAPRQNWTETANRNPIVIGLGLAATLLIAAPFVAYGKWVADAPEREAEWARQQTEQERIAAANAAEGEARFRALGAQSRLDDVLPFLSSGRYQETLALIPTLNSRQADAARMIAIHADLSLFTTLSDFGLDPAEPGLCRAFGTRINTEVQEAMRPGANQQWMATGLESQLANMRWFVAGGCDLSGPIRNLRAALRQQPDYVDTSAFDGELAKLLTPPATPQAPPMP